MREWPEGSRRVITAAFAVLGLGLGVVVLLVWTLRRPADLARTTLREKAAPAEIGLPFQHGPKERRQLRDLSSLAAGTGAGSLIPGMGRPKDRDELVEVQPGDGPVSVSGPGGVTWADRYPSARIVYVTSGAPDTEPAASPTSDAAPPSTGEPEEPARPKPAEARPGSDDPNAAFDPPGQYR